MRLLDIGAIIGFVWILFFLAMLFVSHLGGLEEYAQIGSGFSILSTLFAGLAFAAVISQLRMHQIQIDEEKAARFEAEQRSQELVTEESESRIRAERIGVLGTLIKVTFDKILYERELLLQVVPTFENVSFLHEEDCKRIDTSVDLKEFEIISLTQLIELTRESSELNESFPPSGISPELTKLFEELSKSQAALSMIKQIKKWVVQLGEYEDEMAKLLKPQSE